MGQARHWLDGKVAASETAIILAQPTQMGSEALEGLHVSLRPAGKSTNGSFPIPLLVSTITNFDFVPIDLNTGQNN